MVLIISSRVITPSPSMSSASNAGISSFSGVLYSVTALLVIRRTNEAKSRVFAGGEGRAFASATDFSGSGHGSSSPAQSTLTCACSRSVT